MPSQRINHRPNGLASQLLAHLRAHDLDAAAPRNRTERNRPARTPPPPGSAAPSAHRTNSAPRPWSCRDSSRWPGPAPCSAAWRRFRHAVDPSPADNWPGSTNWYCSDPACPPDALRFERIDDLNLALIERLLAGLLRATRSISTSLFGLPRAECEPASSPARSMAARIASSFGACENLT